MKKILSLVFGIVLLAAIPCIAGDWTVDFLWDSHTQQADVSHFELHEASGAGGPYDDSTIVVDNIEPSSVIEVSYPSTKPDGVATTSYFILRAVGNNSVKSDPSNEVNYIYDFAPIIAATNFSAALQTNMKTVTFEWAQADIDRVHHWLLYKSETSGQDYVELANIEYTGQPGPQYSVTEDLIVPEGEVKTFYFTLVTFTSFNVFSDNATEVSVTIDKRQPEPVYNFRLKIVTQ